MNTINPVHSRRAARSESEITRSKPLAAQSFKRYPDESNRAAIELMLAHAYEFYTRQLKEADHDPAII